MDSVVNLQQIILKYSTMSYMSLHYLVKYESQKNGVNLKHVL